MAPAPAASPSGSGRPTAAIALGAGGVVLVAAGSVFGAMALSKWSSAQDLCGDSGCKAGTRGDAVSDRSHAVTYGDLSTVGFIAGGALLAGALTLYLTAPRGQGTHDDTPQVSLSPSIGGGSLRATF
jgi:hypothetical protein